jgi:hypothetical protein
MSDDIARWRRQRAELQKMLDGFDPAATRAQNTSSHQVALLETRLADIDRHIAALEKRRT